MSEERIALLTPVMPAEAGNGLAMRAGLLLEGLEAAGPVHVVVIPVFGRPVPPTATVRQHAARVTVLPLDRPVSVADITAMLSTPAGRGRAEATHPLPMQCRTATPDAAQDVADLTEDATVIWAFREYLLPFLDAVLERPSRPALVVDVDDVESTTQRRLGQEEEADRFERLEAYYLPRVDHVVTCSEADAHQVSERCGVVAATPVPNAVRPPSRPSVPAATHDLLFVGNLSYAPNVVGARWLCTTVLPLPALAGVTVALVGSRPAPEIRSLACRESVTVVGDVPDVGPWYAGSRVAVVPLPPAGGTRIKVIEAMAHRRPVVSTRAGAEGLGIGGVEPPVLVADSPGDFAAACRQLLDDPVTAADRAQAGEEWVRERACVAAVAPTIAELARSVAQRRSPR